MSLRTRLVLAVGAVLLLALAATDLLISAELRSSLYRQTDTSLATSQRSIAQQVLGLDHHDYDGEPRPDGAVTKDHDPDDRGGSTQQHPSTENNNDGGSASFCDQVELSVAPGDFVEVRSKTGAVSGYVCPAHVGWETYSPKLPRVISGLHSPSEGAAPVSYLTTVSTNPKGPGFRVSATELPAGAPGRELIVASQLGGVDHTLDQLTSIELAVSGSALVLGALLGWLLVYLDLRPLRDIERTAGAIAAGELESRVRGANQRTEVGHVAAALNFMLERIEHAFAARDATEAELRDSEERLRRFVGDASHELRTPIAAVSAYAELFDQGAASRPDDLRRAMGGIRNETARMRRLVEDLLLLARLDEGRSLESQLIELVGLAAEAIETARLVGPEWPIRLVATEPVELLGDALRLRQVVDNLLANVRAHTPKGTEVALSVRREGTNAVLEVTDSGPGMSARDAAKVFDRFYRADPSRARSSGGAGLGLSIVSSIVHAHEGSVTAESTLGEGTRFRVVLPRRLGEEAGGSAPDVAAVGTDERNEHRRHDEAQDLGAMGDPSDRRSRVRRE